jgi:hypothetical protein
MVDGETGDDGERIEVVSRLFYLITAAAEDAAADAANCQSSQMPASERKSAAARLRSSGEMIETIASAIELI